MTFRCLEESVCLSVDGVLCVAGMAAEPADRLQTMKLRFGWEVKRNRMLMRPNIKSFIFFTVTPT